MFGLGKRLQTGVATLSLLGFLFFSYSALAVDNILLMHSYHGEHGWTKFLKQGFNDAFNDDPNTHLFHEYLDAKRYPKGAFADVFLNYIEDKYATTPLSVIVVSDDTAMNIIKPIRENFFPDVPIVFLGINSVSPELIARDDMTGIFENRDIGKTVLDIKAHTGFDELIVITDTSAAGQANVKKIDAIRDLPEAPRQIHIIDKLKDNQIVETFAGYSEATPILLIGQLISPRRDNALLSWDQGTAAVSRWVKNPIYTIAVTTLEHGAVGANELNGRQHALRTAELVKRILSGTSVEDIAPITKAESQWIFNWQNMRRHNIDPSALPSGSLVLHQNESFYQKYKLMVWLVSSAFIVSIFVIVLLIEVIRRGSANRHILAVNESRYRDLAHAGANIFWETDGQFKFSYISGNTLLLLGVDPEQMIGYSFIELFKDSPTVSFPWKEYDKAYDQHHYLKDLVFKVKGQANDLRVLIINGKPIFDDQQQFLGYRGICKEITQEHSLSQQLAYQAAYDSLTGLINRNSFNEKLSHSVSLHQHDGEAFLCFLDLDRFKLVNDTAGHLVGDAMLVEVATVIKNCIGDKDLLGRLGGDEFGLILIGRSRQQAMAVCAEIIHEVSYFRFNWNQRYFNVGVSIGVVPISHNLTATELLSKADLSCYKAKEEGRNRVYFADLDDSELYAEELQMGYIANVTQVIEQEKFYLAKQLIQPLKSDAASGKHYEILIRYRDEQGKVIPPGLFIPAAEKHGVITMIDQWVLTTVLTRYAEYFPGNNTTLSINLSGISLSNKAFVANLINLVKSATVDPKLLCFEITETAAISQLSQALEFMDEMKALGVKFALDDFGSGVSSFGYLKSLPVDYLKIDGSLVKNIVTEPTDKAIVESINAIAHMMNMQTIAEFVENDDIKTVLEEIGVDYVQGYGIGKPRDC